MMVRLAISRTAATLETLSPRPSLGGRAFRIGSPSDALEREADRIADAVVSGRPAAAPASSIAHEAHETPVRRTLRSPYSMSEGVIVEPGEDEEAVQAKGEEPGGAETGTAARLGAAMQAPASGLPGPVRALMERHLGHDFGKVRIHADARAAEATDRIDARAFTRGTDIVFARGQYAPESLEGRWLLAHELTHVVQQGSAPPLVANASAAGRSLAITADDRPHSLRRVKWATARDTGRDSFPWGSGPRGDVYEVETDGGTEIPAWKPHDGTTYWCHGYTFGGSAASGGPFSIWGSSVPRVLVDDGWKPALSCVAQRGDILVFSGNNVAHSGIVYQTSEPGGIVDETASRLDSKWGQAPLNRSSWELNASTYGRYSVHSRMPAYGPCAGKGANER